jgi:uncharacterized membrane protein
VYLDIFQSISHLSIISSTAAGSLLRWPRGSDNYHSFWGMFTAAADKPGQHINRAFSVDELADGQLVPSAAFAIVRHRRIAQ